MSPKRPTRSAARRIAVCGFAALAIVLATGAPASATVGETIVPTTGPPTTVVTVSGSGFAANEFVDVYFDTTDVALVATTDTGGFSGIGVTVPASAVPGRHWISAGGRRSGIAIQKAFLVRTNWSQYKWSSALRGWNPFENVLSPSTVPGLELA